jgi:hypothetical protein
VEAEADDKGTSITKLTALKLKEETRETHFGRRSRCRPESRQPRELS